MKSLNHNNYSIIIWLLQYLNNIKAEIVVWFFFSRFRYCFLFVLTLSSCNGWGTRWQSCILTRNVTACARTFTSRTPFCLLNLNKKLKNQSKSFAMDLKNNNVPLEINNVDQELANKIMKLFTGELVQILIFDFYCPRLWMNLFSSRLKSEIFFKHFINFFLFCSVL